MEDRVALDDLHTAFVSKYDSEKDVKQAEPTAEDDLQEFVKALCMVKQQSDKYPWLRAVALANLQQ